MRHLPVSFKIKNICLYAFILRVCMLIVIMISGKSISLGLLGSEYEQDDMRYTAIAKMYSTTATSIFDANALENALDEAEYKGVGIHDPMNLFQVELWYWIVSVVMYILKSEFLLKIFNILLAVFTIKCIYDIALVLFNKKAAEIASLIYAVLPYPVIFSCFLYKDQFYTLITLLLFRKAMQCTDKIKIYDCLILGLLLFVSAITRTGLVIILVVSVFYIISKQGSFKIKKSTLLLVAALFVIVMTVAVVSSWDIFVKKALDYVVETENSGGHIGLLEIKSFSELYRYPFAYFFSLLQPLSLSFNIENWMDIAGILNIVTIPIAVGNMFYLFSFKIKKTYFYWIGHIFYFITILTSLGIIRHQYYLQPFMMLFYADFILKTKATGLYKVVSALFVFLVLIMWIV